MLADEYGREYWVEVKEVHGVMWPVKVYPYVPPKEVDFWPARSNTKGVGGKVHARGGL